MNELNNERRSSGQYIEIGGNNIRYFEEGEGATLVFIHAIGQAMYTFRKNVHALAEYCHVVTIDLIGHGLSDKPDSDYTVSDFTDLVSDFLDAMGITSATLCGFSTGAMIAADVALRRPDAVEQLIFISPGGITKQYPYLVRALTKPIISDILFTFFSPTMVKRVLAEAYYDPQLNKRDVVRHYYKVLSNKDNLDAAMVSLSAYNDSEIMDQLPALQCPTYVFWGENDTWHPLSMLEVFEDALPEVYAATVPECGHLLHEEKSDEFNKKLIEIMSRQ